MSVSSLPVGKVEFPWRVRKGAILRARGNAALTVVRPSVFAILRLISVLLDHVHGVPQALAHSIERDRKRGDLVVTGFDVGLDAFVSHAHGVGHRRHLLDRCDHEIVQQDIQDQYDERENRNQNAQKRDIGVVGELVLNGSVGDHGGRPEGNVKLPRRRFLHLAASAAALQGFSRMVRAQSYPTRPVRLIVGFAAGGGVDIVARLMGQWLSERLGHQFVVENRPGAGGNIANEAVVRAPPDGYTLLLVGLNSAINATLYEKLNFNFIRDIAPVATRQPLLMLVNPSVPVKTVPEFIAYAKANSGNINMASAGNGTGPHLAGELFKMMAGVNMVHVPYRGGAPALTDLIAGQVQVMFIGPTGVIEYIQSGKLRALGVTTATRSDELPDIPTVGDFVPGYESSQWFGLGAPRNTPPAIIDKLNKGINAGLAEPKLKARFAKLGNTVLPLSPADFGRLIAGETEKWGKVVRAANIKPEGSRRQIVRILPQPRGPGDKGEPPSRKTHQRASGAHEEVIAARFEPKPVPRQPGPR
jgi:tripartite-type tricarboxylate transporter receptor subunit TctC